MRWAIGERMRGKGEDRSDTLREQGVVISRDDIQQGVHYVAASAEEITEVYGRLTALRGELGVLKSTGEEPGDVAQCRFERKGGRQIG